MRRTLIAIALLALAAPGAARAQWSSPIDLHSGAQFVLSPQAMFAGRGEAVVGFGYGLASGATTFAWTRTIPDGGPHFYGRDTNTTDAGALLLTYASSRLLLVSQAHRGFPHELRARFASTSTAPGRTHRLMPGYDTLRYAAAVDARGDAVVAALARRGTSGAFRVVVVRRPAGGSFGRPETIAGRGDAVQVA